MNIIYVLLPLPLSSGTYAYSLPRHAPVPARGTFVTVEVGKRRMLGVVWGKTGNSKVSTDKIKPIEKIHTVMPLPQDLCNTLNFLSAYTITPLGSALKLALPVPLAITNPKYTTAYGLNTPIPNCRITATRQRVIDVLQDGKKCSAEKKFTVEEHDLMALSGARKQTLKALKILGVLFEEKIHHVPTQKISKVFSQSIVLSSAQERAASSIAKYLGVFKPIVLDGMTGSGKTEIYFSIISKVLQQNKQILVLLPEIALSAQWLKRFQKRFGIEPAVWHSEVTQKNRKHIWTGVALNGIKIVVGARSALYLPFTHLGLIVVDEEHEATYKQESGVFYNARDMAIFRAKENMCPIILSSATPSLETWNNVTKKHYAHVKIEERFAKSTPPTIALLDTTKDKIPKGMSVSPVLHTHIGNTLEKGLQTLLFLNRRGYAPITVCTNCTYKFECKNCRSWLVLHRRTNTLICHHCGYETPYSARCPSCGEHKTLIAQGTGVEKLYEEIATTYPKARACIATSETINSRSKAKSFVENMEAGKIDIVIGTQIITKGYHFDNLALVGVIDGDMILKGGDLRAGERTFQMLHQVAGRAGRKNIQGHAFIQTQNPQSPVLQALVHNSRNTFLDVELQQRKIYMQPPFHRLISITVSDKNSKRCENAIKTLAQNAPTAKDIRVFGPAHPHMPYLRGKHRRCLLVNVPKAVKIQPIIVQWIANTKNIAYSTRIQIDVDPQTFS